MSNFISGISNDAKDFYSLLSEEDKSNLKAVVGFTATSAAVSLLGSLFKSPTLQKVGMALNAITFVGTMVSSLSTKADIHPSKPIQRSIPESLQHPSQLTQRSIPESLQHPSQLTQRSISEAFKHPLDSPNSQFYVITQNNNGYSARSVSNQRVIATNVELLVNE